MSIFVLSHSSANDRDDISQLKRLEDLNDFRRATLGMKLGFLAASRALVSLPEHSNRSLLSVVLGTSFGELQSTYQFFSGLALQRLARPLAFQNSLHHSTLGFLSGKLSLTGPGYTVSAEYFSGENALDLAATLLEGGSRQVLVLGVDAVEEQLRDPLEKRIAPGLTAASGAGALLLTRTAPKFPCVEISLLDINLKSPRLQEGFFYDSDAIARISDFLSRGEKKKSLLLPKPDATASEIHFRYHE